jgi:Na+/melibiose symporter-like transporter
VSTADTAGWRSLRRPDQRRSPSPFSRLAIAHALSLAGDTMVTVALAGSLFFNIEPTAARGRVTLSLLLTMAPFAVVAPLLGPAIDRSRGGRRLMVVAAAGGRAVTCVLMAQVVDNLLLFPAAFTALVLSKAHAVAKSSLVPAAVDSEERLVEANAKLSLTGGVAGFVAAGPAVLILKLFDAPWVLGVGAVVFLAAAIAALRIAPARVEQHPAEAEVKEELHHAGVRLAATSMAVLRGAVGFTTFLVAFVFRREHVPSWWFGIVLATSMAGTLLGAAAAPRLRERLREESILTGCLVFVAVGGLFAARMNNRPVTAVFAFIVGFSASAGKLAFDSLVQRDAPKAVQGRSFARFETEFQLVWVVGALIPVVLSIPERVGFFVLAVGPALAALSYVTSRRALRTRGRAPT